MDIEGRRILSLIQRLLRHQGVRGHIRPGDGSEADDRFDVIMDINDQMLERVGSSLEEASGLKKEETKLVVAAANFTPSRSASSWNNKKSTMDPPAKAASAYRLLTARNIQRPQVRFRDKVDNSSQPFRPSITVKPHAVMPLEESLRLPEGVTVEDTERPDFSYPHPYKVEIERFSISDDILKPVTPQEPPALTLTPLMMVATPSQLHGLVTHLATQGELALDLEHHSYRSFQGITCLMQISTRTHDYIIDTLELRSELYKLNQVFADPSITKVLHGADSDVQWLQRDCGLYLVNMFDTGQAARVLGFSRFSLAHLLMCYCKVEPDKQFQLADWRIRPLPEELVRYAREDTHYLLYIYDKMRNDLIARGNSQGNLLRSVYDRSREVALKTYTKPVFSPAVAQDLYRKSKKSFNSQQQAALSALTRWRDQTARMEDESLGYVLPNHMLLQMCEILPRERQGVLACCNPIPPLLRQSLPEVHGLILEAREVTVIKIEKPSRPAAMQHPKYDADSMLSCPHDTSHLSATLARIETDIAETGLVATSASMFDDISSVPLKKSPNISAFKYSKKSKLKNTISLKVKSLFSSPFTKFFKSELSKVIQPQKQDKWKLKQLTEKKSKAEDANAPPKKKIKKEITNGINVFSSPANTSTAPPELPDSKPPVSLFTPPVHIFKSVRYTNASPPPAGVKLNLKDSTESSVHQPTAEKQTDRQKEKKIKEKLKSLRQQVSDEKKEEKEKKRLRKELKRKQMIDEQQMEGSSNISESGTDQEVIQIEASPVARGAKQEVITIQDSPVTTSKPKPEVISVSPSPEVITITDSPLTTDVDHRKKKKKKKTKLTIEEVKEGFQSFDYSSASLAEANTKNVYDFALPSKGKKEKGKGANKARLAGPHSNKSFSFDSQKGKH